MKKLAHCENLWVYTAKFVDSYFNICERDYHCNCIDVDALAVGTADIDKDPMALYFGYYN
jgi:hypothetical protein